MKHDDRLFVGGQRVVRDYPARRNFRKDLSIGSQKEFWEYSGAKGESRNHTLPSFAITACISDHTFWRVSTV